MIEPAVVRNHRTVRRPELWLWGTVLPRAPLWLRRLITRLVFRLPIGSRARNWLVLGASVSIWNATARERWGSVTAVFEPRSAFRFSEEWVVLGFEPIYHGRAGAVRAFEDWSRIWAERRFTVREILDGGKVWVFRMTFWGRGGASGLETQLDASVVSRFDPLVVDWSTMVDDAKALELAGFS